MQNKCDDQNVALRTIFTVLCGSEGEIPASVAEIQAMIVAKIEAERCAATKKSQNFSLKLQKFESDLQFTKVLYNIA